MPRFRPVRSDLFLDPDPDPKSLYFSSLLLNMAVASAGGNSNFSAVYWSIKTHGYVAAWLDGMQILRTQEDIYNKNRRHFIVSDDPYLNLASPALPSITFNFWMMIKKSSFWWFFFLQNIPSAVFVCYPSFYLYNHEKNHIKLHNRACIQRSVIKDLVKTLFLKNL